MRTILKGFYVYNIDTNVEERFFNLLGSGIFLRFQFYNASFESTVEAKPSSWTLASSPGLKTIPQILKMV